MKVERLELLVDRVRRTHIIDGAVDLKVVVVHDDHQVVQPAEPSPHGCLPNLSLLNLPVPAQRVDAVVLPVKLSCGRHSDRR